MTQCKNVSPKKRKVCIGDLRKQVTLQVRVIQPASITSANYVEEFTNVITVWAAIKTTRGYQTFSEVGVSNNVTHEVYIRYDSSFTVTSEDWVEIDSLKYDIVDTENLDERNEFYVLRCIRKGVNTVRANFV